MDFFNDWIFKHLNQLWVATLREGHTPAGNSFLSLFSPQHPSFQPDESEFQFPLILAFVPEMGESIWVAKSINGSSLVGVKPVSGSFNPRKLKPLGGVGFNGDELSKKPSVDEIGERLAPLFQIDGLRLVLLFGSFATSKMHEHSDIDLAFLFDRDIDILALTNDVIRLLHTDNVDVIDLKHATPLLRFSAIKNGRLLYERSQGEFNCFSSLTFRRYVDTKKLRDMQVVSIKHFLETRGIL